MNECKEIVGEIDCHNNNTLIDEERAVKALMDYYHETDEETRKEEREIIELKKSPYFEDIEDMFENNTDSDLEELEQPEHSDLDSLNDFYTEYIDATNYYYENDNIDSIDSIVNDDIYSNRGREH